MINVRRMRLPRSRLAVLLILGASGCPGAAARAQEVAAVMSSDTGPYREALDGFVKGFGAEVPVFYLSRGEPRLPSSTKVVAAFGAKASLRRYGDATLVYAMAPATIVGDARAIKIYMEPEAPVLLARLKELAPALKRLAVFWVSPSYGPYMEELRRAAPLRGAIVESVPLARADEAPEALRSLHGKIDAVWLPPDPLLLNANTLAVFKDFAGANHVLLFVPTPGLAEHGAAASVGVNFQELGRLAGSTAREILKGSPPANRLRSREVDVVINKTAAGEEGLDISEEALKKATRVLP